jgi:hypothetical protein
MSKNAERSWNNGKRSGWSEEEELLLQREVALAHRESRPIKTVFQRIADYTGRKSNSVRNYYYARLKQQGQRPPAFEVFTDQEVREMLIEILSSQAKGMSVRACTLKMGGGDNKAMLRYQNKYRSTIKNNPELVREVIEEMRQKGIPVYDPYVLQSKVKGGEDLAQMISSIVKNVNYVDVDVSKLFDGLYGLSVAAGNGKKVSRKMAEYETRISELENENRDLKQELRHMEAALQETKNAAEMHSNIYFSNRENLNKMISIFRQLVQVNKEFLGQNSVVKVSNLSEYISLLSKHMEDCEKVLID